MCDCADERDVYFSRIFYAQVTDLRGAIGTGKVASLERVVQQQIAPGVRRVIQAGPPLGSPRTGP